MTAAEIIDLVKNVGFPIAVAVFVLYRLDARLGDVNAKLGDVVRALDALGDPDKTAARLKPLFDAQAARIVEDVIHETRAALNPVLMAVARRDAP